MIALVIMVRLTIIGAGDQQQHPHPASSTARDSGAQPNASVRALVMTETLSLINASGSCETRMSGGQEIDLAGILRVRASHRVCLSPNAATRHPPRVRVPHRGIQLENLDRVRSIARTSNPWGPRDFKVAWTKSSKAAAQHYKDSIARMVFGATHLLRAKATKIARPRSSSKY